MWAACPASSAKRPTTPKTAPNTNIEGPKPIEATNFNPLETGLFHKKLPSFPIALSTLPTPLPMDELAIPEIMLLANLNVS